MDELYAPDEAADEAPGAVGLEFGAQSLDIAVGGYDDEEEEEAPLVNSTSRTIATQTTHIIFEHEHENGARQEPQLDQAIQTDAIPLLLRIRIWYLHYLLVPILISILIYSIYSHYATDFQLRLKLEETRHPLIKEYTQTLIERQAKDLKYCEKNLWYSNLRVRRSLNGDEEPGAEKFHSTNDVFVMPGGGTYVVSHHNSNPREVTFRVYDPDWYLSRPVMRTGRYQSKPGKPYLTLTDNSSIVVSFESEIIVLDETGDSFTVKHKLTVPDVQGVVYYNEELYVCEKNKITVRSIKTGEITRVVYEHSMLDPVYITVNRNNGRLLVSNRIDKSIYIIDPVKGEVIKKINVRLKVNDEVVNRGVVSDNDGRILLVDSGNKAVHVLTENGTWLTKVSLPRDVNIPSGIALTSRNELVVTDADEDNGKVLILT